jgi:acyl carrier protein
MTDAEIKGAIAEALHKIAPEIDLDRIGPNDDLREALDIDSFDFLNLLVGLHDKLGIDIPERDYGKLRSLAELVRYLASRAPLSMPGS